MIPDQIHFNQVEIKDRARSEYHGIEDLAQSLLDNGLIQPVVLVPLSLENTAPLDVDGERMGVEFEVKYGLDAGGRRSRALKYLLDTNQWDGILHHATTCASDPFRPGFVLKGDDEASPLKRLLTEIAENQDRHNLDWRDEVKALVRAWKLARAEASSKGEKCLMRDFGAMLGVSYAQLQAANAIYEAVVTNPERFADCNSIKGAYSKLLADQAAHVVKIQANKSLGVKPLVRAPIEPKPEERNGEVEVVEEPTNEPVELPHIDLSAAYKNIPFGNGFEIMDKESIDIIYTDPDYGLSLDVLGASSTNAASGVAQATPEQSWNDIVELIRGAFKVVKPQGWFVFWYDLDWHERLQATCVDIGWLVQRWPLIWHKTDYRSNGSPQHNFCKNIEYAMVCRKHNAVLTKAQMSSVWSGPTGSVTKDFHHPFAKPLDLHKWILSAIAIRGQICLDPCMGSATIPCAAAEFGLKPLGFEVNPDHYHNGILNTQRTYRNLLGNEVNFS